MKKFLSSTTLFSLLSVSASFSQNNADNFLTLKEFQSPTCYNTNDGWITLGTNPAAGAQSIVWNTNDTTMSLTNLGAGTYIYTLTNAYGQSITDSIVLTNPTALDIQAEVINPTSSTSQNGSIVVSNLMGTEFSYNWTTLNGSGLDLNSLDQSTLGVGKYKLLIENGLGCSAIRIFDLLVTAPVLNDPATVISGSSGIFINNQNHNLLAGSSPLKGKAHITTGEDTESVEIYNQRGEKIRVPELEMNNSIQTIDLESGNYIVRFNLLDGTKESRQLLVE